MRKVSLSLQHSPVKQYGQVTILSSVGINFFYIGQKAEKIRLLTKGFGEGRYYENTETALLHIKQLSTENELPGVVVLEGETDEYLLKELNRIVTANHNFTSIPFILDVCGLQDQKIKQCPYLQFLDDSILLTESNLNTFVSQVRFLQRIKKGSSPHVKASAEIASETPYDLKAVIKGVIDFAVSLLAVIILSPLFLFIALAIKLESPGPVFYVSLRAGRGYKVFRFYKFRTMVPDADKKITQLYHLNQYDAAEKQPVFFKAANDPRRTRVGRFLRNASLDELPQFFNVLLGNMSLVGNRPLPLGEAAALTTDEWAKRFMAPAGITGLWQIKNKRNGSMSAEERINLDIEYANKCNFAYDLWIIVRTPVTLIRRSNT